MRTSGARELDLPEDSSASQLACWAMCGRKFYFRYVAKAEPEFRSTSLLLSSAFHSTIGWFFEQKLVGRRPRPEQAEAIFDADFTAEVSEGNVRWGHTSEDDVALQGRSLVRAYLKVFFGLPVAHVQQPYRVGIEDSETGLSLPRAFKGYFDLVLKDSTVVQVSAATKWRPIDLLRQLRVGATVAAKCELDGGPVTVDVHVVTKAKTPQVDVHRVTRGEPGNRWWFHAALDIENAILAGSFPASPGPMCHECEYQRRCEQWTGVAVDSHQRRLPVAAAHAA